MYTCREALTGKGLYRFSTTYDARNGSLEEFRSTLDRVAGTLCDARSGSEETLRHARSAVFKIIVIEFILYRK